MGNQYSYDIETLNKSKEKICIGTSRAEIELVPDPEKGGELRTATVTIKGRHKFENFLLAKQELAKVLLRYTCEHPRIIERHGLLPGKWTLESGEEIRFDDVREFSPHFREHVFRNVNPGDYWCLRIDVNSASPAIQCYYEAIERDFPIDRYRELYKVIEYFSGIRDNGKRNEDWKRIRDHLDREKGWHIDETAMQWARQAFKEKDLTKSGLAGKLHELRNKCSHMRPEYGLKPNDFEGISEISNIIPILDRIVRCSLEMHLETKEASP